MRETIEQFLARGGRIEVIRPVSTACVCRMPRCICSFRLPAGAPSFEPHVEFDENAQFDPRARPAAMQGARNKTIAVLW
jgi:hypothetical protein